MAAYVVKEDLTAEQRKGLKWFASNVPGGEIAGPGPFTGGQDFAANVLRVLGDRGWAARNAAKSSMTQSIYVAKPDPTRKSEIEAEVAALFPDTE